MLEQKPRQVSQQLSLSIHLQDEATLDNFCWGKNGLLREQIYHLIEHEHNFLYIWGEPGVGKSHLLQACCKHKSIEADSIYLPLKLLKEWGPEVLDSLEEKKLICIDDIHCIAGVEAWEEALFHLYNKIRDLGHVSLIISGTLPLRSLDIKLPDLHSRLQWGLVVQTHGLNDEDKIKVLQQRAKKRGIKLKDKVCQFLVNKTSRNMHDLFIILDKLDVASLNEQRPITIPFVKRVLES